VTALQGGLEGVERMHEYWLVYISNFHCE